MMSFIARPASLFASMGFWAELWDNAINSGDYDYKKEMESTPIAQITSQQAAIEILQGISRNQEDIVFPFVTRLIVRLYRMFPGAMTGVVTTPLLKSLKQSLKSRG